MKTSFSSIWPKNIFTTLFQRSYFNYIIEKNILKDRNGCSHKCHLDNEGNAICSCPDANYILDADKKTCLYDLQGKNNS